MARSDRGRRARGHVINITLPPLRDRRGDIAPLVESFLVRQGGGRAKKLTNACLSRLLDYPWPGNVRELENEIERLVVLAGDAPTIGEGLLSPRIRQFAPAEPELVVDTDSLPAAMEALERRMITAAMRRHHGNKTRAAEELKVSRRNLIRLVQKYELEKSS
jgi:two-component system, NtrC family, response regulator HupR/HoxA